jgi:sRNA-binding protein
VRRREYNNYILILINGKASLRYLENTIAGNARIGLADRPVGVATEPQAASARGRTTNRRSRYKMNF